MTQATNESQKRLKTKLDDLLALAITDPIAARQQALAQEGGKVGRGKSSEKTAERQGARDLIASKQARSMETQLSLALSHRQRVERHLQD